MLGFYQILKKLDIDNYEYYSIIQNKNLYNIKFALEFVDEGNFNHYYRFFFKNGTFRSYYPKQIIIRKNALLDVRVSNVMEYLREISNITGLKLDDGTNILKEIYNKIDKSPVLAVEVDGYTYHDKNARQQERDGIKDTVFEKYNIPLIRFNTTGGGEKEKLINKLSEILGNA